MSNNKQSSIEWLIEQMKSEKYLGDIDFEQAKAMHKEERISDYYQGACDESDSHGAQSIVRADAERWYNETFGEK